MTRPSKLILIRHAPIEKVDGRLPENDPNAIIDDMRMQKLASQLPKGCTCYVSPLKRAIQTATVLSRYVNFSDIIIEQHLVEQNFGDWAGKSISDVWDEIKSNKGIHNFSFICPEVIPPNGDSFLRQCERMSLWLEREHFAESQTVVVIAHSGTIRAALSCMLGLQPDTAIGIEILHLSLNIFEVLPKYDQRRRGGRFRLLSVNKEVS